MVIELVKKIHNKKLWSYY